MNDVKLTPDQLHLEVLKAMGWKWKDSNETAFGASRPLKKWHNPQGKVAAPPPLTLDLMWQAEEMLSEVDCGWVKYIEELTEITLTPVGGFQHFSKRDIFQLSHATAEQRARAFLKVKGIA